MECVIRPAREEDVQRLLAIYAPYVTNTAITFEYEIPSTEEFAHRIRTVMEKLPWLVCEADGEIAGYAYAAPYKSRAAFQWDAELSVYLDKKFHRRGIASALYRSLKEILTAQGYYNLYALIALPDQGSVDFHRSQGFAMAGVLPLTGYKLGQWWDLAVMELPLREAYHTPEPTKSFAEIPADVICSALSFRP